MELSKNDSRMDTVIQAVNAIELEQAQARELLATNTRTIERVETNTQEMLQVFQSWKGAMRVLELLGKLARPLGYIATLIAAVLAGYSAIKNGIFLR